MTSSMKFMMKKQETLNVNQRPLTEVQLKDSYYRIVDYTADDVHGFQATVRRQSSKVIIIKLMLFNFTSKVL